MRVHVSSEKKVPVDHNPTCSAFSVVSPPGFYRLQGLFIMKNYWMYKVFMQGLGAEKHSVSPEAVEKCKEMFRDTAQDVGHPLTYLSDPQKAGNEEKIGCVRNVYGITEYDITPQAEAVLSGLVGVESARSIFFRYSLS